MGTPREIDLSVAGELLTLLVASLTEIDLADFRPWERGSPWTYPGLVRQIRGFRILKADFSGQYRLLVASG